MEILIFGRSIGCCSGENGWVKVLLLNKASSFLLEFIGPYLNLLRFVSFELTGHQN